MLRETSHEMSLIAFEKKQLLQQWKSALIGLNRRDEALTTAQNALKEAEISARCDMNIAGSSVGDEGGCIDFILQRDTNCHNPLRG